MTSFYLAASYDLAPTMRECREVLEMLGHSVTSRWIDHHPEIGGPDGLTVEMINDPEYLELCQETADHDLRDIDKADEVISFSGASTTGARHVEFGYALAMRKPIHIIGKNENLFHVDSLVDRYDSFSEFVLILHSNSMKQAILQREIAEELAYQFACGGEPAESYMDAAEGVLRVVMRASDDE